MTDTSSGFWARFAAFRHRHHKLQELAFFFGGFCFDLLLLHSIDSTPMLIHQGSYVLLLALLIGVDHHIAVKGEEPKGLWGKIVSIRIWVIHFFFGTLLNAFVVFYFRAASLTSLGFLLFMPLLAGVLIANELPYFRKLGPVTRVALWSFVVTSYFAYLFPVLLGRVSVFLFTLSVVLSSLALYGLYRAYTRFTHDPQWTFQRAVMPGLGVQAALLVLYFAGVVPPVPLSLKWIGVYHRVTKEPENHRAKLEYVPTGFKPWQHGAQTFLARPGDKVWVWTRVFAPKGFRDALYVRWLWDDPKLGWTGTDAIPLEIHHGEHEGWYGGTNKKNWLPGDWKVRVETDDGRVIGSISLTIVTDPGTNGVDVSDAGVAGTDERPMVTEYR